MTNSVTFSNVSTINPRSTPSSDLSYDTPPRKKTMKATRMFPDDYKQLLFKKISPKSLGETFIINSKGRQRKYHPTIACMIEEAILERSTRAKGLSLFGIKRFMREKYDVDVKRTAKRIREYINQSVENGRLLRRTGRGANGSFRLAKNVRVQLRKKNAPEHSNRIKSSKVKIKSLVENIRKRNGDSVVEAPKKRKTMPAGRNN